MSTPHVYTAICAVMADIGTTGISKARKNQQQGYSFRGIDDVYNELNHLLAKHKLIMTPRILAREVVERQTQKGGALFNVTVEAEFDFVSAQDGTLHTVRTYGEAMDSADKATNKAMSAAYKYAAMMVFCIPTEGDNDADAITYDVAAAPAPKAVSAAEMKRGLEAIDADLLDCASVHAVNTCAKTWASIMERDGWSKDYRDIAAPKFQQRRNTIKEAEGAFPGDMPAPITDAVRNILAG
jgi:hypothetical protein